MKTSTESLRKTEDRLRRAVPALPPPDAARVNRACERIRAAPPPQSLFKDARTFVRPLLRLAACAALLLVAALLLRPRTPTADWPAGAPALPPVASLTDLAEMVRQQSVSDALAGEARSLSSDLTELSDALNARSFAILF